jgi:hypothetical protein
MIDPYWSIVVRPSFGVTAPATAALAMSEDISL